MMNQRLHVKKRIVVILFFGAAFFMLASPSFAEAKREEPKREEMKRETTADFFIENRLRLLEAAIDRAKHRTDRVEPFLKRKNGASNEVLNTTFEKARQHIALADAAMRELRSHLKKERVDESAASEVRRLLKAVDREMQAAYLILREAAVSPR